ncbi:type II pantothenate kinase [Rossellomorea aquimaris]|uniref:Pantothenate kinase n=1 Tax=Rossellomorea aquimaris TaxID=189382 RepID=A0A366EW88_9BACI|nr:type II pantothenate kinase [Rossellomorea aquimaris]RBP06661.1 pantothenate kinase [Rossellomorea aquimaris]
MSVIGVDAGGTLTKIVYEENGALHFKTFSSEQQVLQWLGILAQNHKLYITGGKAEKWRGIFPHAHIVGEFEAVCSGAKLLLKEEKTDLKQFTLINIGTGTSFFKVDENGCERLLGSGLGGGTFMGLGGLLTGESDYYELVRLSKEGKRELVDLSVRDVYEAMNSPVPDHLTAANFAKGDAFSKKADKLRALTNMIAETIILLASQASQAHKLEDFVFIGSTLKSNPALKEDLSQFQDMLSYTPIFPEKGAYAGSLGAFDVGRGSEHSQNRQ